MLSVLDCFIDIDEKKWGNYYLGKVINSPEYLINNEEVTCVLIASSFISDIIPILEEYKYSNKVICGSYFVFSTAFEYELLEKHIDEIKSWMYDEKSKNIVDAILSKRKNHIFDYSDICEDDQYFVEDIVPRDKESVFVDVGAYDGDTIEQFIKYQNGKYKAIYAFEMDEDNYKKIQEKDFESKVSVYNYGIWDEKKEIKYESFGMQSRLVKGTKIAKCITMDEILKDKYVSYIKMDIEGAEYRALLGAKDIIKRCKPNLAICIYHKPEDIYDITKMLKEWLPEHKFYIRHHKRVFWDTVLYVIKNE